ISPGTETGHDPRYPLFGSSTGCRFALAEYAAAGTLSSCCCAQFHLGTYFGYTRAATCDHDPIADLHSIPAVLRAALSAWRRARTGAGPGIQGHHQDGWSTRPRHPHIHAEVHRTL